ncbi:GNAT family N-acetyltransferase [Streptomyces sp. SID13031]|uniref:GNAT family N-acetyltransferase n=1 Tax=Streptomyces sp. SID13031 TaxID=2706046 RepID=UPI0013CD101A|nr:GNAT family N-acetyltransferase [Streptomyces sp. SID13031]NEA33050.1 GNAT family N-acetyltransferase [Streptomyces sp. SID13031]
MAGLPDGMTVRPMRLDDAPAIQAHLSSYSISLIGVHQYSPEGVVNFLREPALDLATDTWLVSSGDEITGSAATVRMAGRVNLEVSSGDRDVAGWLLDQAIEHATERARESGEPELLMALGMLRADRQLAELAQEHGLALATSTDRMKIEHTGPVDPPAVPSGVTVHRGASDEKVRRAGHQVIAESFADQPTAVPRPYDEWVESRDSRSTFDWSGLTVLELDGRPVAVREWDRNYVSSENCGYIGRLGVLAEARGRGLARFLLRDQFALDAAAGLSGTLLHVDTSNPTPAVKLYVSAGMRPDIVNDIWRSTLQL